MKRLNPATGLPFKKGDTRENGDVFYQYRKIIEAWSSPYFVEYWLKPEKFKQHNFTDRSGNDRTIKNVAANLLKGAQSRCRGCPSRTAAGRPPTNGKITITKQWILDRLEKGVCEATGDKLTIEPRQPNTASLDRIDSNNPDYTPENCRIVTWQFNNMRGAYTDAEFIRVAKQLENVKKRSAAPVSTGNHQQGEIYPELGAVSLPGAGQDSDDSHHHCGTIHWEDVNHRAQTSSGDSLGRGVQEVATFVTPARIENYGSPEPTIVWIADRGGYIPHKP